MRILAIETATADCNVALAVGGEVLQAHASPGGQKPSEQVPGLVAQVLAEAGTGLSDLDAIAFDHGPGAFTGIRIGCGLAQGMALGAGLPLLGVCSLRVLAVQAPEGRVLATLDARMGEVYWACVWRGDASGRPDSRVLGDVRVESPAALCWPEDVTLALGDGLAVALPAPAAAGSAASRLLERLPTHLQVVDAHARPRARDMLPLAAADLQAGLAMAPEAASPLYVRDKVALTAAEQRARRASR